MNGGRPGQPEKLGELSTADGQPAGVCLDERRGLRPRPAEPTAGSARRSTCYVVPVVLSRERRAGGEQAGFNRGFEFLAGFLRGGVVFHLVHQLLVEAFAAGADRAQAAAVDQRHEGGEVAGGAGVEVVEGPRASIPGILCQDEFLFDRLSRAASAGGPRRPRSGTAAASAGWCGVRTGRRSLAGKALAQDAALRTPTPT